MAPGKAIDKIIGKFYYFLFLL